MTLTSNKLVDRGCHLELVRIGSLHIKSIVKPVRGLSWGTPFHPTLFQASCHEIAQNVSPHLAENPGPSTAPEKFDKRCPHGFGHQRQAVPGIREGLTSYPQGLKDPQILWLVVYQPLWKIYKNMKVSWDDDWKIWVRQLGWWFFPIWMESHNPNVPNHQPVL